MHVIVELKGHAYVIARKEGEPGYEATGWLSVAFNLLFCSAKTWLSENITGY